MRQHSTEGEGDASKDGPPEALRSETEGARRPAMGPGGSQPRSPDLPEARRTPLYDLHREMGAKMVPFAGWDMPVQYPKGILQEHLWCRGHAGLFDVSHMGQLRIEGADAAAAMERLVPGNIEGLAPGSAR